MRSLSLRVYGDPVPQGSKRAFPIYRGKGKDRQPTGQVVVTDAAGSRLAEWRQAIVHAGRTALGDEPPLQGPLLVTLTFYLHKPKRPKHAYPATRPDWEKLARAVGDALKNAGVYEDDGQIVTATVRKRYATTETAGVLVSLTEEPE